MRPLPLLLFLAAACATVRVGEVPPPAPNLGPPLQLVDNLPDTTCVRRDEVAILEGVGTDSLRTAPQWPKDCLPTARVLPDDALLKWAEVVLEPRQAGLRTARAATRGVLASPRGLHRRGLRWALALSFEQAGLEGVVYVDAATGARLSDKDGHLGAQDLFLTVPPGSWGGTVPAQPYRPPNAAWLEEPSLSPSLPDAEFAIYEARCVKDEEPCHLEHLGLENTCLRAQMANCVEPLERDFASRVRPKLAARERPLAVLARKPGEVRWLTDQREVLAFLGHPLASIQEARLLLAAEGTVMPAPLPGNEPGGGYFRFEDPAVELKPGGCSGFFLEADGTRGPICLPRVPCHPPTAAQRAQLPRGGPVPSEVCEGGDGSFSFTSDASGCACSTTLRKGAMVAHSCAPCAHRGP